MYARPVARRRRTTLPAAGVDACGYTYVGMSGARSKSSWSKFNVCLMLLVCLQDGTAWALNKVSRTSKGERRVPRGKRCEECFQSWAGAFKDAYTWEEYAEAKSEGDEELEARPAQSKMGHTDPDTKPFVPQRVVRCYEHTLRIENQCVLLVTASQLRGLLSTYRLPKMLGVPCMRVPGEDGCTLEDAYVFNDPDPQGRSNVDGYKKATLETSINDQRFETFLSERTHT